MTAKLLSNGWDRSWILVGYVCAAYDRSHHLFRVFVATESLIRVAAEPKQHRIANAVVCYCTVLCKATEYQNVLF